MPLLTSTRHHTLWPMTYRVPGAGMPFPMDHAISQRNTPTDSLVHIPPYKTGFKEGKRFFLCWQAPVPTFDMLQVDAEVWLEVLPPHTPRKQTRKQSRLMVVGIALMWVTGGSSVFSWVGGRGGGYFETEHGVGLRPRFNAFS